MAPFSADQGAGGEYVPENLLDRLLAEARAAYEFQGIHSEDVYSSSDGKRGVHSRERNKLVSECENAFGLHPTLDSINRMLAEAHLDGQKLEWAEALLFEITEALKEEGDPYSEMEESLYEKLMHCQGKPDQLINLGALAKLIKPPVVKKPKKEVPDDDVDIESLTYRTFRRVQGKSKPE